MKWTKKLEKEMEEEWGLEFSHIFSSDVIFHLEGAEENMVIFPRSESTSIEEWIKETINHDDTHDLDRIELQKHYDKYKKIKEEKKLLEQTITAQSTTKKEKFKL